MGSRLIDRHGVSQAIMVQLTGGVFLTGYALALRAPSTVIGLLAGVPFMVKVSQLYLSWRIERAGHWRRSALEGALLGRSALLVAAIGPLAAGVGSGAWPAPRRQRSRLEPTSVRAALSKPVHDPNYLRLLIFIGLWGISGGVVAPFFPCTCSRSFASRFLTTTIFEERPGERTGRKRSTGGRLRGWSR